MKNILVVGESCRDVFIYCNSNRICPDVPVPILNIVGQTENAGMAKNVFRNVKALGESASLITNEEWYNITKTRYVHDSSNHMFFRVDTPHKISRINLDSIDYRHSIIVVSDYNKGFLTEEDIKTICDNHDNVFIDTKKILGPWASKAKYIKINDFEYKNSLKFITEELSDKIVHTRGADGCGFRGTTYPVKRAEVKDASGAGDSFMAALVVKYLQTENIEESIRFANKCASGVVKKKGVAVI